MPLRRVLAVACTGAELSLLVSREEEGDEADEAGEEVEMGREAGAPPPLHSLLQLRLGGPAAGWELTYHRLLAVRSQPSEALMLFRSLSKV